MKMSQGSGVSGDWGVGTRGMGSGVNMTVSQFDFIRALLSLFLAYQFTINYDHNR